jgi:hypothetical protein
MAAPIPNPQDTIFNFHFDPPSSSCSRLMVELQSAGM